MIRLLPRGAGSKIPCAALLLTAFLGFGKSFHCAPRPQGSPALDGMDFVRRIYAEPRCYAGRAMRYRLPVAQKTRQIYTPSNAWSLPESISRTSRR